jgi:hypothetical protein
VESTDGRGRPFASGLSLAEVLPGFGATVVGKTAGCPAGTGRDISTSFALSRALCDSQVADPDARIQDQEEVFDCTGRDMLLGRRKRSSAQCTDAIPKFRKTPCALFVFFS